MGESGVPKGDRPNVYHLRPGAVRRLRRTTPLGDAALAVAASRLAVVENKQYSTYVLLATTTAGQRILDRVYEFDHVQLYRSVEKALEAVARAWEKVPAADKLRILLRP